MTDVKIQAGAGGEPDTVVWRCIAADCGEGSMTLEDGASITVGEGCSITCGVCREPMKREVEGG